MSFDAPDPGVGDLSCCRGVQRKMPVYRSDRRGVTRAIGADDKRACNIRCRAILQTSSPKRWSSDPPPDHRRCGWSVCRWLWQQPDGLVDCELPNLAGAPCRVGWKHPASRARLQRRGRRRPLRRGPLLPTWGPLSAGTPQFSDKAAQAYKKALTMKPKYRSAMFNLAIVDTPNQPQSALNLYNELLLQNPKDANVSFNLGLLLIAQNQPVPGHAALKRAISLDSALAARVPAGITP